MGKQLAHSGIAMFAHCKQCLQELPAGVSPREWNRTETGWLPDGRIRVWCIRHEREVVTIRVVSPA